MKRIQAPRSDLDVKDRAWQSVTLSLPAGATGAETLEFSYQAEGEAKTLGAWARAILLPRVDPAR